MSKRSYGYEMCSHCGTAIVSLPRIYNDSLYHESCFALVRSPFTQSTFWLDNLQTEAAQQRIKRSLGLNK